jgi:hypothetical protein
VSWGDVYREQAHTWAMVARQREQAGAPEKDIRFARDAVAVYERLEAQYEAFVNQGKSVGLEDGR